IPERDARLLALIARVLSQQPVLGSYLSGYTVARHPIAHLPVHPQPSVALPSVSSWKKTKQMLSQHKPLRHPKPVNLIISCSPSLDFHLHPQICSS
ncbi:hypothetical protein AMECASPLE_030587, partial [Ameca splendens]